MLLEEALSDQRPLNVVGEFVDIAQKRIAGFASPKTRFYVRQESVDLWNEIENVTNEGTNLRVSGPPGTGKSIEVWAWALWKAKTTRKKVLWFGIGKGFKKNVVVIDGETQNLTEYEAEIDYIKDFEGDFIVADGVTINLDKEITAACATWRERREGRSFITVSSVTIGVGLEILESLNLTTRQVPSWSLDQYEAAIKDDDFFDSVKNCLKVNDDDVVDGLSSDEKVDLLRAKYYYAGGSARWMFEFNIEKMLADFEYHFIKVTNFDDIYFEAGGAVALSVNHMRSLLKKKSGALAYTFISRYALRRFYAKVADKVNFFTDIYRLDDLYRLASQKKNQEQNPVLSEFCFELDFDSQLDACIKDEKNLVVYDGEKDVEWQISKKVDFDKESSVLTKVKAFFQEENDMCKHFWLRPQKCNQGAYDFLHFYYDENKKLCMDAVDTTISRTHGLNLQALKNLVETFAKGNLPIDTISFIFVIPRNKNQENLTIKKPRGDMGAFWDRKSEVSELLEAKFVTVVQVNRTKEGLQLPPPPSSQA